MVSLMKRPSAGVLLRRSAVRTRNLLLLAAALACALVSGHPALTVAAVWLYALLLVRDVSSARFAKGLAADDAERLTRLPESAELADPGLRIMVSSIRAGYVAIARVLRRAPPSVLAHARAALASLQALRPQAARLIREADELSTYLRDVPRGAVESELQRLERALERANDDARTEYERAVSIRRDQLAALDRMQREHDRINASLERVIGTVEAFPAWIYRLRLLERAAREDLVSDADGDLQRMYEELSSSQELLESLAACQGASWSPLPPNVR